MDCLEHGPECEGIVLLRWTPDRDDLKQFPRCDFHHRRRQERAEENMRRYPVNPPADFDPSYAGESWDEG